MIVLVAVLVLLAAAPAANAKSITEIEVCGRGGCNVLVPGNGLTQRDLLALTEVAAPADPPAAPYGWFRVRVTIEHHGADESSWTNAWVPSAGLLRAGDDTGDGYTWFTVPRDTALSLRKVTHRLDPLPAATLRGLGPTAVTAPDDGMPWAWIALVPAAACATAAWLRRRVRPQGPDGPGDERCDDRRSGSRPSGRRSIITTSRSP